jgi:hypothetical protein
MQALRHASNLQVVCESDWLWIADIDEFPNIHVGDGSFAELINACGQPRRFRCVFSSLPIAILPRSTTGL